VSEGLQSVAHEILEPTGFQPVVVQSASMTPELIEEVGGRISNNESAPIAYDVLAEAKALAYRRPSLSLLGAVQALELGTKHALALLIPPAHELIFSLPAPPVKDLLVTHIPALIADQRIKEVYTQFILGLENSIKGIVQQRNQCAHRGLNVSSLAATKACGVVGNTLYHLDFVIGHSWAENARWATWKC